MTYYEEDGRGEVVPELGLRFGGGGDNGGYVKLTMGPEEFGPAEGGFGGSPEPSSPTNGRSWWYWARFVLLLACGGLLAAVFIKWIGPFFMDKVCDFFFFLLLLPFLSCTILYCCCVYCFFTLKK